jgi:hypothetical protein
MDREFPIPSQDVTTKLSLAGNYDVLTELFLPRGSLVSDIPAGDGKLVNLFLRCMSLSVGIQQIQFYCMCDALSTCTKIESFITYVCVC